MRVAKEKGFEKRAQYYASKAYISQANAGGEYHDLKEVIFLAIADFVMFPKKTSYKSDHVILDKESHENDLKDFSFTSIELPKFEKKIDALSNMVEKWCFFFKHAEETSERDLKMMIGQDPIIERAYEELDRFSWNQQELLTYDQAEKYEKTYHASLGQKFDEGKAEGEKLGLQKGEKLGLQKGEKLGIAKGQKLAIFQVAQNLLDKGFDLQTIQTVTGLSIKEIETLKKKTK